MGNSPLSRLLLQVVTPSPNLPDAVDRVLGWWHFIFDCVLFIIVGKLPIEADFTLATWKYIWSLLYFVILYWKQTLPGTQVRGQRSERGSERERLRDWDARDPRHCCSCWLGWLTRAFSLQISMGLFLALIWEYMKWRLAPSSSRWPLGISLKKLQMWL